MQDFEPFHVQLRGKDAHPSRITARSRHAGCKPAANNVVGHSYDRDCLSRALRRADIQVAKGDDEIDVLRDKLVSQGGRALAAALRPSEPDANVTSLFPTDRFHVAPEGLSEGLSDVLRIGSQNADYWQAALLCTRRERPRGRRASEQRDELAPLHVEHGASFPVPSLVARRATRCPSGWNVDRQKHDYADQERLKRDFRDVETPTP